ncbi:MAG: hypothetical protein GXP28_07165 [Planctomycetes bacterium]|nr:hypothetical protein [Planctomycetota bacterium]
MPALRACLLVATTCLGLAGCSEQKMGQVAGSIVYSGDGAAAVELSGYRVSFLCFENQADGKQNRVTATGLVREDGTFTVNTYEIGDGAVLGTHQVAITPPITYEYDGGPIKIHIDPRYGSPKQSELTAVVDGDTEVVLEVQRAP